MTNSLKRQIGIWIGIAAAVSLAFLFLSRDTVKVPSVDLTTMEPQVAERLQAYIDAVKAEPQDGDAWSKLAQGLQAHDLFAPAIDAYTKALTLDPEDWRWPYLAALAQSKSDPEASLGLFRQAVALKPTGAAIHINFGDNLVRLGLSEEAKQSYLRALDADPQSSHALYGLAQIALVENEVDAAVDLLERAADVAPGHGEIYGLQAQAYSRLGDEDAAERATLLARARPGSTRAADPVVQGMESRAVDSQAIARAGVSLAKRGEFAKAEAKFREVLSIRPGNARDYANLGGALAGQGKSEEALRAYRKGLEIDPDDVDLLNNLGFSLQQTGNLDEAEQQLQKALSVDPTFAPAHGNLGLIAQQRQDSQPAIEHFEKALTLDPGLQFARNALATEFAATGNVDAAVEQWQKVLEVSPNELAALFNIAMAKAALGDHAEAIDRLRQGLGIAPDSSRFVAALAWQLATAPEDELRDGAEAMQLAQRVYQAYPNQPQIIDVMAAALAETGDFANAVKLMEPLAGAEGGNQGQFAMRLKAYRREQPWRQPTSAAITAPAGEPGP